VSYKGTKQVQEGAIGRANDMCHLGVNQGAEDQRLLALFLRALVDAISDRLGFLDGIDEGDPDGLKFELSELRQDGVAESFGGNARAVGNDKDGTLNRRRRHGISRAQCSGNGTICKITIYRSNRGMERQVCLGQITQTALLGSLP
jgi:hypothetical protein